MKREYSTYKKKKLELGRLIEELKRYERQETRKYNDCLCI